MPRVPAVVRLGGAEPISKITVFGEVGFLRSLYRSPVDKSPGLFDK